MMLFPHCTTLKSGLQVELDLMQPSEQEAVRSLFNTIIKEGETYPQKFPLSESEFAAYWMSGTAYVVQANATIVGAFFLKPNFPGRSSHIANAGFIVHPDLRGQGIGRFMGESVLQIARDLGYGALQFNLVFETNIASIALWKSLDFSIVGRLPNAVKLANDQMIDALIFYRSLSQ